jgi:hypothetical protein
VPGILESEGNEDAFREPFVSAVLSVVGNKQFADCGLGLVEAFDRLPLFQTLETMKSPDLFREESLRSYLPDVLRNKVRRILFPPQPEPVKAPSTRERRAAEKRAAASARLAETERNLELGRKLIALREQTPSNKEFGRLRTRQFDIGATLGAEVMRVARLYGDRPEIHRKIRWRALVELSSTTMRESRRQAFERRIVAGENVKAKEIAVPSAGPPPRTPEVRYANA